MQGDREWQRREKRLKWGWDGEVEGRDLWPFAKGSVNRHEGLDRGSGMKEENERGEKGE